MWVVDDSFKAKVGNALVQKIFAYNLGDTNLTTKSRVVNKEFTLSLTNENPWGIWLNRTNMWVLNWYDKKIYAYDMNAEVSDSSDVSNASTLIALRLSGIGLNPAFSPDEEIYTALVDYTVASTTVTATLNDSGTSVNIFSGVRAQPESPIEKVLMLP